ncbi:hypothetical protein [Streptomyces sp. SS]|uniref:hypothetical protein n=1 Tax=Streptomyces sp. SS TaxID=260742 RepID=UPI000377EB9D|nr:hypothetical protein [Streptomyces sp. SS]
MAPQHGEGDRGEAADLGLDPRGEILAGERAHRAGERRRPALVTRRPGPRRDGPQGQPDDEHALRRTRFGSEGDDALHQAPIPAADLPVGLPEVGQCGGVRSRPARAGVVFRRHVLGVVLVEALVPGDRQQVLEVLVVGGKRKPQREARERVPEAPGALVEIPLPSGVVAHRDRRDRTAGPAARGRARRSGGQFRTESLQVAQEPLGQPGVPEQVEGPRRGCLGPTRCHAAQRAVRIDDEHDVPEARHAVAVAKADGKPARRDAP